MTKVSISNRCSYLILQTDTHFDAGYLCKLKPSKSRYGPRYERIDDDICNICNNYTIGISKQT